MIIIVINPLIETIVGVHTFMLRPPPFSNQSCPELHSRGQQTAGGTVSVCEQFEFVGVSEQYEDC